MVPKISKGKLVEKYSALIPDPEVLDGIGPGWYGLVANLCHSINTHASMRIGKESEGESGLYLRNLRPENGGFVVELAAPDDDLMDVIQQAEDLSHQICASCMGGKDDPERKYCQSCRHEAD